MRKVTVKHYLNKTIKPISDGKLNRYPLYVQVIADRVNYKMKSNFNYFDGYLDDIDFNLELIQNYIKRENEEISKVVSFLIENEKKEFLNANCFKKLSMNLWSELNDNFCELFIKEGEEFTDGILPNAFYRASFYDIEEILTFTQSEVDITYFSEKYRYAKIGMKALQYTSLMKEHKDLKINELTVFDFIFSEEGRSRVLEGVKRLHGFHGGDEESDYNNVLQALEEILSLH